MLVTGGSSGLGLHIAFAFGRQGARVVLWARDSMRLSQAVEQLAREGIQAEGMSIDVGSDEAVLDGLARLESRFGRLDVLVNGVGRSTRSNLATTSVADYREFMEVNFETAVRCSLACLELLTRSQGHLVNIGSLSSKTAWPFMAPYTTSKFALAGFTQQLRLEGPPGVHCMLVCPGPIRREDAGHRYDQASGSLPDAAAKPGGGAPVKGLAPEFIAKKIVRGCERTAS